MNLFDIPENDPEMESFEARLANLKIDAEVERREADVLYRCGWQAARASAPPAAPNNAWKSFALGNLSALAACVLVLVAWQAIDAPTTQQPMAELPGQRGVMGEVQGGTAKGNEADAAPQPPSAEGQGGRLEPEPQFARAEARVQRLSWFSPWPVSRTIEGEESQVLSPAASGRWQSLLEREPVLVRSNRTGAGRPAEAAPMLKALPGQADALEDFL